MITLDGSHGEGGGQILRTALALSMITKKPFKITNIRKNRPTPGLKAQHLAGIKALLELSDSKCENIEAGAEAIEFYPSEINKFKAKIDILTAGPITLVLQSILLPLMLAKKRSIIEIIGGTDAAWSPSIDYFNYVILPQFNRYADIKLKLDKRGYYPNGGGKITLHIKPKNEKPSLDLTNQGKLFSIKGISHSSRELLDANVSDRQTHAANMLLSSLNKPVQINSEYKETDCAGSGITVWAIFGKTDEINFSDPIILGADDLGKKGKRAEFVGEKAAKELLKEIKSGAAADKHLADNLIPLLGLYGGKIKTSEITLHIKSNIYVTEQFLDVNFEIDNDKTISVNGIQGKP